MIPSSLWLIVFTYSVAVQKIVLKMVPTEKLDKIQPTKSVVVPFCFITVPWTTDKLSNLAATGTFNVLNSLLNWSTLTGYYCLPQPTAVC